MIIGGGKIIAIISVIELAGCSTIINTLAPPYVPIPIHIYDAARFNIDSAECKLAGVNWTPSFSFGALATKTIDGATSNTSLIPISPLVPLYGAAGGAASAASDGLDIASGQHANVYRNCLHDETQIDRSAVVANPN